MKIEVCICRGYFYSPKFPEIVRPFESFRVNDHTVEVRFTDGQGPLVVSVTSMTLDDIRTALEHATQEMVTIEGDILTS